MAEVMDPKPSGGLEVFFGIIVELLEFFLISRDPPERLHPSREAGGNRQRVRRGNHQIKAGGVLLGVCLITIARQP